MRWTTWTLAVGAVAAVALPIIAVPMDDSSARSALLVIWWVLLAALLVSALASAFVRGRASSTSGPAGRKDTADAEDAAQRARVHGETAASIRASQNTPGGAF
ncbi:hypothetical protein GCM10025865_11300 [Paraoerskovia sediminicola]|uniref:Uncharacterized protein n=1 Tax=Paraoerskovia sediminicola TaxID=1138587 RepID=A0ABM8G1F5_9CELL|nr:hypothetical protein [Paraoerskovia sediminicola]BDZ41831.1 hypothetical protein GCM10025865_11300 [Paraoerskovia sediminicola]